MSALDVFVSSGFVPAPWTLVEGIERIGAGELLRWRDGTTARERYYDIPTDLVEADLTTRIGTLRDTLFESVSERVTDPDHTAVLLSGGVDSMLLLAIASRVAGRPIRSFTFRYAGYEGPLNEGRQAAACARHVGSPHEEIVVDPLLVPDRLGTLLDNFGEPFSLGIHTAMIDQIAGTGVRDLLSGSASDSTYCEGQVINADRFARLSRPLRAAVRAGTWTLKRADDARMRRTAGAHLPVIGGLTSALHGGIWTARTSLNYHEGDWALRRVLRSELYHDRGLLDRALERRHELFRTEADRVAGLPLLSAARVLECRNFDAEIMYAWNLNSTRPWNLTLRAPYASREVLEGRMRFLPTVEGKPDVRAVAAELLPREMAYAPKVHQAIPLSSWLRGPLRPFISDVLGADRLRAVGTFEPRAVRSLLDAHMEGRADNGWGLWTLTLATLWQERLAGDRWLENAA
jgi:asparagine synthase (glutamine-hydrolysing)